jgi:hypothetical protein
LWRYMYAFIHDASFSSFWPESRKYAAPSPLPPSTSYLIGFY